MRGNVCELSLASWTSSSSWPPEPMSLSLSSALKNSNNSRLLLLGKSIVFQKHPKQQQQQQQRDHQKGTSHNKTLINSSNNENPMRHIKRIKQLFLPVCAHEIKHEIANHYRDVKYKRASKEARAKAKLYRQQQLQHQQQLQELRKKAAFAKLVSTAIVHRRRPAAVTTAQPPSSTVHHHHHRRFILSHQRNVLQIPSLTFPRVISHESTINVRKGRQTLCNFYRPNDLYGAAQQASGKKPLTIVNSTARLIQKGHQRDLTQLFTSFQSIACNAKASQIKPNLFQSIANGWPLAQTSYFRHPLPVPLSHYCCRCRRGRQKSEWQTCTTNQQKSHVGIHTVAITKTAPPSPDCNYNRQQRKTYSCDIDRSRSNKNNQNHSGSNDDNRYCINDKNNSNFIDTNKTEWYIHLASNCYRNGFQLHVNHLDERSKHPCLVQRKPIQVLSFLRLPSSALQPTNSGIHNKKTVRVSHDQPSTTISTLCNFIGDSSIITNKHQIRVTCDEQNNLNCNKNVLNCDCKAKNSHLSHQLKNNYENNDESDDIKRIYVKNSLKLSDTHHHHHLSICSIDDSSKLPIINTERIVRQQQGHNQQQVQHIDKIEQQQQQQFDTPNAKNTMNSSSIAIDANNIHLQQTTNRQLSCQAIQTNYQNNNLTFDREFHAGAQQSVPPTPLSSSSSTPHTLFNEDSIIGSVATAADATAIAFGAVTAVATNIADNAITPSATIFNNTNTNNVNNNQQQHHHHHHRWLNENNSNSQSIGTRQAATTNNRIDDIAVDDLIESFKTKFDVTDPTQRHKLPQIILSDFSNNQLLLSTSSPSPSPSPSLSVSLPLSTTPLAFAIQSTHTLSEHPEQLHDLQHFFPSNR